MKPDDDEELTRMNQARWEGRKADNLFKKRCLAYGLDVDFAVLAPLACMADAEAAPLLWRRAK